jgi:hypothetical protein
VSEGDVTRGGPEGRGITEGRGGLNTAEGEEGPDGGAALDATGEDGAGSGATGLEPTPGGAGVTPGKDGTLRRALGGGGGALRAGTGNGSGVAPGGKLRRGGGGGCALGRGTSETGVPVPLLGRGGALTGRGGVTRLSPDPLFEASSSAMAPVDSGAALLEE